jgi:glutaconate CoA-transferase subunit B
MRGGGPSRIITDKCVMGFDPESHTASLVSLHPEVSLEDVLANTGFALNVPEDIPITALPAQEELRLLREEIDPKNVYLGALE